ncbi:MAG: hypothetical protein AB8D78_14960 [Akkermansiaceae bacterium]
MPLRALLWDEDLFAGVVRTFTGMEWGEWVSSLEVDDGINRAIRVQGLLFLAIGIAALVPLHSLWISGFYLFGSLNLIFLAWLKYHDSGDGIAQFFEHSSQFLLPIILLLAISGKRWHLLAMVSIALTFIGHGMFAVGLPSETSWLNHPRPGSFLEMTMLCLGLDSEITAGRILVAAGVLDFVVVALLFFRGWPRLSGLAYMFAWGLATAIARPWAYYEPTAAAESLIRWIPEMLYRAPHFGIPLCLLLAFLLRNKHPQPSPN